MIQKYIIEIEGDENTKWLCSEKEFSSDAELMLKRMIMHRTKGTEPFVKVFKPCFLCGSNPRRDKGRRGAELCQSCYEICALFNFKDDVATKLNSTGTIPRVTIKPLGREQIIEMIADEILAVITGLQQMHIKK